MPPVVVTVRTLHCPVDVVDVVDDEDVDVEAVEVEGDEEGDELVVAPGVVVVVGLAPDVDVTSDVGVVEDSTFADVVVSEGATATGCSPTWESARPTICHVSTVATTRAATHAAAIRQEIISRFSQDRPQCGINGPSRFPQDPI